MSLTTNVLIEKGESVEDIIPFVEAEPPVETHLPEWQLKAIKEMKFKVTYTDDQQAEEEVIDAEDQEQEEEVITEDQETEEEEATNIEDQEEEIEEEESSELTITEEDIQRLGSISSWKDLESFVAEKLDSTLESLGLTKDEGYTLKTAKAELEDQLS